MAICLILAIIFFVLWIQEHNKTTKSSADIKSLNEQLDYSRNQISDLSEQLKQSQEREDTLSQYKPIVDIQAEVDRIKVEAEKEIEELKSTAQSEVDQLKSDAKEKNQIARTRLNDAEAEATRKIGSATDEAVRIIDEAKKRAEEIAGDAYRALESVNDLRETEQALKNIIYGYGDQWLKPTYSLLDELADDFSHTDAGVKLKDARANSVRMVKENKAATCDYVEAKRKNIAINFVIDAFNGKVDSILSKTKKDNFGKLEREIQDAYLIVNNNGQAFRNARITPEYLDSRMQELKWAVVVNELKAQAQEEQRQLREKMREEARAQKEFERAQKEAAKEEAMLKKAMEKAQSMLEKANEAQKAEFEAQLADLEKKLKEAEEKNQRALSMAQQTKHGNVYVISNIGSFGENIYKVGMTRRLNPLDRVRELGDASVPFSFDVHAVIESDDAPALEHTLHQELALMQVNKVNPRKEFFRVSLHDIRSLVESHNLNVNWTMEAEATEYRETLAIEERMKSDPDAQAQWEAFYSRLNTDDSDE